jgi:uncharacterized SAM-binding protein YcdF (DUF218 family)
VKRWVERAVAVGCIGVLAWGIAAVKAFRLPEIDPPRTTDAYYLLASGGGVAAVSAGLDRFPKESSVVLSVTTDLMLLPDYRSTCARTDREIHCITPDPLTTQGEARGFARLAAARDWSSVTVISQVSHTTRARILMKRCFPGEVRMNPIDTEDGRRTWARSLVYESGAMVKTWLTPGC